MGLVFTRRPGDEFRLYTSDGVVTIRVETMFHKSRGVQIHIDAPKAMRVVRGEIDHGSTFAGIPESIALTDAELEIGEDAPLRLKQRPPDPIIEKRKRPAEEP